MTQSAATYMQPQNVPDIEDVPTEILLALLQAANAYLEDETEINLLQFQKLLTEAKECENYSSRRVIA